MKLIKNIRIVSPDTDLKLANIVIDGQNIKSITEKEVNSDNFEQVIDGEGLVAMPGFIDIHTHGAVGYDTCDGKIENIEKIAEARMKEGVTTFLPTTVTESPECLLEAAAHVGEYMKTQKYAEVLGMHIEGPYIACAWKGAQNPDYIRKPDVEEIKRINALAPVKIVTIALEVEGMNEFISEMDKMGIICSAGHSGATYKQFLEAKAVGLKHLTHFFNQMSPLHHREIGLVGSGLTDSDILIELICDKVHVIPEIIKMVFSVKPVRQILLITDSLNAAGLPDGKYVMGGLDMYVKKQEARLESGALMGSTLPYQKGLKNVYEITNLELKDLVKATSYNQAQSLKLDNLGKIEKDYRANIVIMDNNWQVRHTIIGGQVKYSATK